MKLELKIVKNGSSLAVNIPKAIINALGKSKGDTIKIEIKED